MKARLSISKILDTGNRKSEFIEQLQLRRIYLGYGYYIDSRTSELTLFFSVKLYYNEITIYAFLNISPLF